jgi:hypothetical protein
MYRSAVANASDSYMSSCFIAPHRDGLNEDSLDGEPVFRDGQEVILFLPSATALEATLPA